MTVSLVRIKRWTKFFLLFILFTLLVYQIIAFMLPFWKDELLYPTPKGDGAVKVFAPYTDQNDMSTYTKKIKDRLYWFYFVGE